MSSGQRGEVGNDPSAADDSAIDMKRVILHHIFKIWQESWSQQLDIKTAPVQPVIGMFGAAWPKIGPCAIKNSESTSLSHWSYSPSPPHKHFFVG
ncbi:hypothetical protein TNCV_864571 [Trichonephila clavipes]|nr:hypothetical protein TNCV_864571 [Trichonephila clavipes]